ncbi:CotO family spore coat protein [Pseudogracilibacillus sp. SE30717A]|uniref:CotO family spore coat protein n=1 Tax=Pseudogracilibacillus sp. SE30717A TaxID=3098293 RepID=UPI00300E0F9F
MMEGERIIEPLLYIDQPNFQKPKAYMQENYVGLTIDHVIEKEKNVEEPIRKDRNSSFKQLTVSEKIDYLVNVPNEVAQIRCEVVLEDKNIRGTVIEEDKEEITMKVLGRENKKIKKEDIKNILLLGF